MKRGLSIKSFCKRSLAFVLSLAMVLTGLYPVTANAEVTTSVEVNLVEGESYTIKGEAGMTITTEPETSVATADIQDILEVNAPMYNHIANTGSSLSSFSTTANEGIELSNVEFTFIASGDNWMIYNEFANVYWRNETGAGAFFDSRTSEAKVTPSAEVENAFTICRSTGSRYIIFYNNNMDFNSNSGFTANYGGGSYNLILLEKQAAVSEADVIPGYKQVSEIVDGNKYLIAYRWPADETNVFVMYPTNGTANQTKLVKTTDDITAAQVSELTITANAEGATTVVAGDVTYNVTVSYDPANASKDYDVNKITATTGSENPSVNNNEGPLSYAFDGNENTWWHSDYTNTIWWNIANANMQDYLWVEMAFESAVWVDALRYLPRGGGNGNITGYRVEGTADGEVWTTLTEGTWTTSGWQIAQFEAVELTAIRLVATATQGNAANNRYANAKEIRVRTADEPIVTPEPTADYTAVNKAIEAANALEKDNYVDFSAVEAAIAAVVEGKKITEQAEVDAMAKAITDAIDALVVKADKSYLEEALAAYRNMDLSSFTSSTAKVLADAIAAAEAVMADEYAAQSEVDNARTNLLDAYRALKLKANKNELQRLVDEVSDLNLEKYTAASRKAFEEAMEHACEVLANEEVSQEEVNDASIVLDSAYNGLVDISILLNYLETYRSFDFSKYTPSSVSVLEKALENAREVVANENAAFAEVNNAVIMIIEAQEDLVVRADKTSLEYYLNEYRNTDTSNMAPSTVEFFVEAFAEAETVMADGNATQTMVNYALERLMGAYSVLRYKADKTDLEAIIKECEAIDTTGYTEETAEAFKLTLAWAKEVLANEDALQVGVDAAVDDLVKAREALEELVEATELAILTQPTSADVLNGEIAETTVLAQGDGLTYTWYYKNPGNKKFYASGDEFVNGNTYSIEMAKWRDGQEVYCVITDAYGDSVQTDTVTLSIRKAAFEIVSQPEDVVVAAKGDTAEVTVVATGETLTYTWYYKNPGNVKFYVSGSEFVSEDGATYTIPVENWRDGQEVYCVITDATGATVQSNTVTLSFAK